MDGFIKGIGLALAAVILCIGLSDRGKHFTIAIALAVVCAVGVLAFSYLEPVMAFFRSLQAFAGWNPELMQVLLKSVGIGILADISILICNDSGQAALGKSIGFLAAAVILWVSLPLYSGLMDLINEILGAL